MLYFLLHLMVIFFPRKLWWQFLYFLAEALFYFVFSTFLAFYPACSACLFMQAWFFMFLPGDFSSMFPQDPWPSSVFWFWFILFFPVIYGLASSIYSSWFPTCLLFSLHLVFFSGIILYVVLAFLNSMFVHMLRQVSLLFTLYRLPAASDQLNEMYCLQT